MEGFKSYPGLQVFHNDQFGEIRVLSISGEPWYVGTDVAGALGYKNTYQALNGHVDIEDKRLLRDMKNVVPYQNDIVQVAQYQNATVPPSGVTLINESGLYALILTSKLPKAKAFKRWVTSEVLPTIRKQGFYNPSLKSSLNLNPALIPTTANYPPPIQSKREPTFEEILKAAELVMKCGDNRLSYVLAMLRQYGFEIPEYNS